MYSHCESGGGWILGNEIDGTQAEYVRLPFADNSTYPVPAGVSDEELSVAKSKILSRVVRGSERPMGRMQAVGMGWTYLRTYRSVDEELARFEAVSLKDVRGVLDRHPFDQLTVLALGPLAGLV